MACIAAEAARSTKGHGDYLAAEIGNSVRMTTMNNRRPRCKNPNHVRELLSAAPSPNPIMLARLCARYECASSISPRRPLRHFDYPTSVSGRDCGILAAAAAARLMAAAGSTHPAKIDLCPAEPEQLERRGAGHFHSWPLVFERSDTNHLLVVGLTATAIVLRTSSPGP